MLAQFRLSFLGKDRCSYAGEMIGNGLHFSLPGSPALFEVTFGRFEGVECDEGLLRLPAFPCLNYAFPMKASVASK